MRSFYITIMVLVALSSCQSNTQKNTPSASNEVENTQNEGLLSSTLETILLSTDDVVRNVDFSMSKADVETIEQIEAVKSTDNETLYSIDLSDTDFADITYDYDGNGSLTKVQIDVFTENTESTKRYFTEFETYFNEKYMKVDDLWDGVDYTVFLKNFSTDDNGLYIVWEKN